MIEKNHFFKGIIKFCKEKHSGIIYRGCHQYYLGTKAAQQRLRDAYKNCGTE